jgi:hypothetical protein
MDFREWREKSNKKTLLRIEKGFSGGYSILIWEGKKV